MAGFITLLISIAITLGIFLLIRGITLWYFRINEAIRFAEWQKDLLAQHVAQNKEMIRLLKKIAGEPEENAAKAESQEEMKHAQL